MSTDRDMTRVVRSWLEEGVTVLPDRVLDTVLDQVPATPQRRPWWPAWRFASMNPYAKLAAAGAAVLIVAVVGYNLLPSRGGIGGPGPTSAPTPVSSSTPVPSPSLMTVPQGSSPRPLVAGSYIVTDPFSVKVGFTIPAGWQGNVGGPYFMAVERAQAGTGGLYFSVLGNVFADPCRSDKGLASPSIGPSVDELVTALTHLKGVTATSPVETTFAGHPATSFTVAPSVSPAACTGGYMSLWRLPLGATADLSAGQTDRLWVLTAGTTRLVVEADDYTGEPSTVTAEVQAVLDSVTIAP